MRQKSKSDPLQNRNSNLRNVSFKPSPQLQAFLAVEPKPIYIGFGSIIVKDPDALTKTIIEGVRLSGQRAILAKGKCHLYH